MFVPPVLTDLAAGVRAQLASGYHRDDHLPCRGIIKMLNDDGKMSNNSGGLGRLTQVGRKGGQRLFWFYEQIPKVRERDKSEGQEDQEAGFDPLPQDSNPEANIRNAARRP